MQVMTVILIHRFIIYMYCVFDVVSVHIQVFVSWRGVRLCQLKSLQRDMGVSGKVWVRQEVSASIVCVCVCICMCVHHDIIVHVSRFSSVCWCVS